MFPNFGTSEHPTTNTQHPTSSGLKMLGEAIVKGMAVTAKNFFGSYVSKERLTTVQYPEERLEPKENTRQFPFLVYDTDDAEKGLRCVACQICVEVCPFESIKMDTEFELSTDDRFGGLLFTKDKLSKSNAHYQKIHPHDAADSDAVIAGEKAKAEAKAKAAAEAKAKAAAAAPAPPANP